MSAAPITASAPITTSENEANASEWSMPSTYMSLETTPGSAVETTSSLMSLLSNPTTYDALPPVSSGSVPTADSSLSLERILEQAAQIVADSSNTTTRESSSAANTQFRDPSSTFNAQDNNVSKGGSLSSMSSLATLFLPEQSAEASGAEESGVLSLSMMAHAPPAAQREQEYCPMNDATEESLEAAQSAPDAQSPTEETAAGGTKRKRVSRACDICWKKKTKCINSHQSACDNCRQNGFTCTYFRDSKRRGPKALNPFDKVRDLTARPFFDFDF